MDEEREEIERENERENYMNAFKLRENVFFSLTKDYEEKHENLRKFGR
jgi:hypothetical protein